MRLTYIDCKGNMIATTSGTQPQLHRNVMSDVNTNFTGWWDARYTVFAYCSAAKFPQDILTFLNILKRRLLTETLSFAITQIKSRNEQDK